MKWTKRKPTKVGYYFYREICGKDYEQYIVAVTEQRAVLLPHLPNPIKKHYQICAIPVEIFGINGEWAGPIPEPKEPA